MINQRRLFCERLEDRRMLAADNGVPLFDPSVPLEPYRNPAIGDGPVLLHSGELVYRAADLVIPGRGLDWSFQRTYRSGVTFEGPLGHNWDHNFNRRLVEVNVTNLSDVRQTFDRAEVGDVGRMDGTGRADLYVKNRDGSYAAPAGFYMRLTKEADGTFRERNRDGLEVRYAATDADGLSRMTSIEDRNANQMTLAYEEIDPDVAKSGDEKFVLAFVIDTMGREIRYQYYASTIQLVDGRELTLAHPTDNSAAWGRLAHVIDFKGDLDFDGHASARTIVFDYDEESKGAISLRH